MTKVLLLMFVVVLVAWRIRRGVRAFRLALERARQAAQAGVGAAPGGRSIPSTVELATCSECREAVPKARCRETDRGLICSQCDTESA